MSRIPEPMNTSEQYQYAMLMRLDALCNMVNSLVEHIAERDGVSVEQVKEEIKKPRKRKVKADESAETDKAGS